MQIFDVTITLGDLTVGDLARLNRIFMFYTPDTVGQVIAEVQNAIVETEIIGKESAGRFMSALMDLPFVESVTIKKRKETPA